MSATFKKITARAKQLRARRPSMKWTSAIKEASKELRRSGAIGRLQANVIAGTRKRRRKVGKVKRRKVTRVKRRKVGAYKFIEKKETKHTPAKKTYRVTRAKSGRITSMATVSGMKSKIVKDLECRLGELLIKRELNTKAAPHHKLTRQITQIRRDIKKYSK